jgi:hypothetical protein
MDKKCTVNDSLFKKMLQIMSPAAYIKNSLTELASWSSPHTCFKYGFDESIKTHVIEITPKNEFYHAELLTEAWVNMSLAFMAQYPTEDIVFITADSPLALARYQFAYTHQPATSSSPACIE